MGHRLTPPVRPQPHRPTGFAFIGKEAKNNPKFAFDGNFDGDDMNDGEELKRGRSPVIFGDASVCAPEYGCGARLARLPEPGLGDARPWLAGLAAFALFSRIATKRRRRRRAITGAP